MMSDRLKDIKVCVDVITGDEKMSELSSAIAGTFSVSLAAIAVLLFRNATKLKSTTSALEEKENDYE